MKLRKLFIAVLLAGMMGAFVVSCSEDRLDILPQTETPLEGGIKSVDDIQRLLNNTYSSLGSTSNMGLNRIVYGELFSDNAFVSQINDGYFVSSNLMNFTDTSGESADTWSSNYGTIRNANIIIYSDLGEDQMAQEAIEIRAQAHLIRGMAYFNLIQFFSPSPAIAPDSPYGVVIKNEPWNPNPMSVRSTLQESYQAVLDDINTALANLPETAPNKYTFTKTTAKFMLAKVYLYFGKNDLAQQYANEVINNSPSTYSFIDAENYVDYFSANDNEGLQENQPETIWEYPQTVNFNFQVNAHIGVFFANNGQHRSILYRPAFKDIFPDSDIRKNLFGVDGPTGDEPRGIFIKKWQRKSDEGPFTQDIKVFRMTEAKFIKWEAMAKSGNGGAALNELNAFAESRGGNTYTGDALAAVLAEKQKEFYGEGLRYFDLKRNALAIDKPTNCAGNCQISPEDKLFVLPIPISEINLNPEIQQYPGY